MSSARTKKATKVTPKRAGLVTRLSCLLLNSSLKVFQCCNRFSIQVKHRLAKLELCGLGSKYLGQDLERHPNIVIFCHAATRVYSLEIWRGWARAYRFIVNQ